MTAWPSGPDREAIRRAARGLWEWTRYVWAQAEQTLGQELGIVLDTAAFLEAIERPYDWDRQGLTRAEPSYAHSPLNTSMHSAPLRSLVRNSQESPHRKS